ncbi:putative transcription factor interactor and regulator CCHC(Zn) family [Helianthus annuus]|nr:putative transcription factor interactor and regulator CCHC(Zn) family [Helianthus annuus]
MARTRTTRGGRTGGRSGGRRTGRVPVTRNQREESVSERESLPALENENHDVLGSDIREAIADEVYQVLHNSMPQIIAEAVKAATEDGRGARRVHEEPDLVLSSDEDNGVFASRVAARGCSYGDFMKCKPPPFDGTKDVSVAHQWLREMEAVLKISKCRREDMVTYATHSSSSEALCWWDNLTQAMGDRAVKRMKWEELKKLVIDQFCPTHELDKLERQFINLEGGNMTHKEYTTKFNKLARLFPDLVTPEEKRIKRYVQGLPVDIRRGVVTTKMSSMHSVVALSGTLYEQRDTTHPSDPRRNWNSNRNLDGKRSGPDNTGPAFKRVKIEANEGKGSSDDRKNCGKCGRFHSGECRQGSGVCFRCGKTGHLHYECPTLTCFKCRGTGHLASKCTGGSDAGKSSKGNVRDIPKTKARAFSLSRKEAKEKADVVSGIKRGISFVYSYFFLLAKKKKIHVILFQVLS